MFDNLSCYLMMQGSIMSQLLFIYYMNDIAHASKMFDFTIYADDTTLSTITEIVVIIKH